MRNRPNAHKHRTKTTMRHCYSCVALLLSLAAATSLRADQPDGYTTSLLDGKNAFQTSQFFAIDGGWAFE